MKYEVWAIMAGNVNSAGKPKTARFGFYTYLPAAEKHVAELVKSDYYRRVRLVEIPNESDNKPYKRKTTIYKP